jgi:hypothetical protein
VSGHGIDASEDLARLVGDLGKALFERRGEAAAADLMRARPASGFGGEADDGPAEAAREVKK